MTEETVEYSDRCCMLSFGVIKNYKDPTFKDVKNFFLLFSFFLFKAKMELI